MTDSRPLVWLLAVVHVHVLGVNYVARFLLLLAAARTGSGGRPAARGTPSGRPGSLRLVELLGDFVHGPLHILGGRAQPRRSAFGHGLLRVLDGGFHRLDVAFLQLVAVFANRFLRVENQSVQPVPGLDFLEPPAVIFRMRLRFRAHLLGFFLGQAAGSGDGDLLLFARGLVLSAHVQDEIRIDVKGHYNLRNAAWGWWNSVQLEFPKRTVVRSKFAFTLQDVNLHA